MLIYESGIERNALTWYGRQGRRLDTIAEPGARWALALSHDDSTALYARTDPESGGIGIWRADTRRRGALPITRGPHWNWSPVFAPDDRSMVYLSLRLGPPQLFIQGLEPGSSARPLPRLDGLSYPIDWTSDGLRVLLMHRVPPGPWGIWEIDPTGRSDPRLLVTEMGETSRARVAPTRDLLAVSANASEGWQIYLQNYPEGGERIRVSKSGGVQPTWRGDGRELYFLGLDSDLYAVPVSRHRRLEVGRPVRLFHLPLQGPLHLYQEYEPSRDGSRFLVNALVEGRGAPARVVMGWESLLNRRREPTP